VQIALLALLAPPAAAQPAPGAGLPPGGAPGISDVPTGEGTIVGRVTGDAGPGGTAGLDVVLYAVPAEGEPGLRRGVADAQGVVRFEGVSTDPRITYLLGTRAGDVPFGTRAAFGPGETRLEVALDVMQPIAETAQARVERSELRVESSCEGVRISEVHHLENPTGRVILVPEAERASQHPLLRAVLPEQAGPLETAFGTPPQGLVRAGRELAFWGPLYPGRQQLEFLYRLDPPGPALERGFPDGAPRVTVLSEPGGARLGGPALRAAGTREVEGRAFDAAEAGRLAAGTELALTLDPGPGADARLRLPEVDVWLELDDAALQVDEEHRLAVAADAPLEAKAGAPLVCLPLPPGAQDLRFAPEALAMGLEPDPSGALAVRGPIPAGESTLALRYRLPAPGGAANLSRRFSLPLELLSVFVADTGVRVDAERLHRRRSVRTNDRSWLQFEAFQVEAGEPVELALSVEPAPRPLPGLAHAGFALLAALAAFAFLIGPLRRGAPAERGESGAERLAAERASVMSAIRDLDDDFETGKLTAEDHAGLREELRAQAIQLLAEERKPPKASEGGPPQGLPASPQGAQRGEAERSHQGPRFCVDCGSALPAAARFCPGCGVRLSDRSGPG
jgi:hypothetical protein